MREWLQNMIKNDSTKSQQSIAMSNTTTPKILQETIFQFFDKSIGNTYLPKDNKNLTVFIDDISMPKINQWKDQVTNELLRQLIEYKGLYNRGTKAGDFLNFEKLSIMGAMAQPLHGRQDIPMRLKRHFTIINTSMPDKFAILKIFGTIAAAHFENKSNKFSYDIQNEMLNILNVTYDIWSESKEKRLPTPAKFFYQFSIRDLSRVWEGITRIKTEQLQNLQDLYNLWYHEVTRVIHDRFIDDEDRKWFHECVHSLNIPQEIKSNLNEHSFVDFMRDAPEATGDEPEDFDFSPPRIYEPVPEINFMN